jgi:hypothetical protein
MRRRNTRRTERRTVGCSRCGGATRAATLTPDVRVETRASSLRRGNRSVVPIASLMEPVSGGSATGMEPPDRHGHGATSAAWAEGSPPSWSHPIARVMGPPDRQGHSVTSAAWAEGSPPSWSHPIARIVEPPAGWAEVDRHHHGATRSPGSWRHFRSLGLVTGAAGGPSSFSMLGERVRWMLSSGKAQSTDSRTTPTTSLSMASPLAPDSADRWLNEGGEWQAASTRYGTSTHGGARHVTESCLGARAEGALTQPDGWWAARCAYDFDDAAVLSWWTRRTAAWRHHQNRPRYFLFG